MGKLIWMNRCGDREQKWTANDPASVTEAETAFNEAMKKGAAMFVGHGTQAAEQIREFDPTAEEIVVVPQIAGGR